MIKINYFLFLTAVPLLIIMNFSQLEGGNKKNIFSVSVLGGINWGGIVDNRRVDTVTSATRWRYNAGLRSEFNISEHYLEAGLEYFYIDQTISYSDASESIDGHRDFSLHNLKYSLTYNFHFYNDRHRNPMLIIKLGLFGLYTLNQKVTERGTLNSYDIKKWTIGPTFGASFYPLRINKYCNIGLYIDFSRGMGIKYYEDSYHDTMALGDMSNMQMGLISRFYFYGL